MRRKVYVNDLSTILASSSSRSSFISWAVSKQIDTFLYYGTKSYLNASSTNSWAVDPTKSNILGNFLAEARTSGITSHVAVVGGYREFYGAYSTWENEDYNYKWGNPGKGGNKFINKFNAFHAYDPTKTFLSPLSSTTDFSGINLELEYYIDHTKINANTGLPTYPQGATNYGYYNGYNNGAGAINGSTGNALFDELIYNFEAFTRIMDLWRMNRSAYGKGQSMKEVLEHYIGWFLPTGQELNMAKVLVKNLDFINVHAYRTGYPSGMTSGNPYTLAAFGNDLFGYTRQRLNWIGMAANQLYGPTYKKKIHIIYSMEGDFSRNWMLANPTVTFDDLHNSYVNAFNAYSGSLFTYKNNIEIDGYTLFQSTLSRAVRP